MQRQGRKEKNREKKKLMKIKKQVQQTVSSDELPKFCPYCHGHMLLKKIGDLDKKSYYKNRDILICENFETCGCSVKLNVLPNGKKVPFGIPANSEVKSLRRELHYYMDYYVRLSGMNETDVYKWLAEKSNIAVERCHFSMLLEGQGKSMLQMFLDAIYSFVKLNPEKMKAAGDFKPYVYDKWYDGTWSATDPKAQETIKKIQEINKTIKRG